MDEKTIEQGPSLNPSAWVDQYGDYLYRYALSRLRDPESSEEVVQETFVAALRNVEQYSGRGEERAWLLGILKRKIVDLVRQRNRTASLGTDDGGDPTEVLFTRRGFWKSDPRIFGSDPAEPIEREEFWEIFRGCLEGLPQRQADAFTLREMDGRAGEEICKELHVSSSNLWVLLYRARLRLADCMKTRWQAEGGR